MRHLILIQILLIPFLGFSQFKNTSDLIKVGDSVLFTTIGAKYLDFYKLDTNSYYIYKTFFNQDTKTLIVENRKIKRKFSNAYLHYRIDYPDLRELSSILYVDIDKHGFIETISNNTPKFILENSPCDFISKNKVVEIGDSLLKEKGIRIEYKLFLDYETKKFIWEIDNIIRDFTEQAFMDGLKEIIKINPVSSEIIEHRLVEYGFVF